ncbi:MAG: hypothetical protein OQK82_06510 [Candidatus Pacearchaeota archaeon]|nr:hypothetical protein [Candidatus Pacearchaeota archaeon]
MNNWQPLNQEKLKQIQQIFSEIYSSEEYQDLDFKISTYWIEKLKKIWENKKENLKNQDTDYNDLDPLSRIQQKTVIITYADSVKEENKKSLTTLQEFLNQYFPAIKGMHILPACQVEESRFNDGYFSQVVRNKIHESFGDNAQFEEIMHKYYSMTDFVLNHVDIDNPKFQEYINGDETAKDCFYIFSEEEYQKRKLDSDFDKIFRPRPFPLFSIFRRKPVNEKFSQISYEEKIDYLNKIFTNIGLDSLPKEILGLITIFNKIKNDQMLLDEDYNHIINFIKYIETKEIKKEDIFTTSTTQETENIPYIFKEEIKSIKDLLEKIKISNSEKYSEEYLKNNKEIFGEEFRALTTFSHVQVDLNTSTYEGLKLLIDDFAWYLEMDLNMLRLDAANFAFKKWKTNCFGLPEVNKLLKIMYLSMDCVSPRDIPNLEVNNKLSYILNQMSNKEAAPPMMYDFHLASLLPIVFNQKDSTILSRIFEKIKEYNIPKNSIRFSVAESHDGKSVLGSADLLSISERQSLVEVIKENNGQIKYKGVNKKQYPLEEFKDICKETNLDFETTKNVLFEKESEDTLYLKNEINDSIDLSKALNINQEEFDKNKTFTFFTKKIFEGQEPYELCTSTFNSLKKLNNNQLEQKRYIAFYTLAFALMGRNVKSIYFNDLLALPNDYERFKKSGEKRDLKRTKSYYNKLVKELNQENNINKISKEINNLIALIDSDIALNFRGNEAETINLDKEVAIIHNNYESNHTLTIINLSETENKISIDLEKLNKEKWFDNISQEEIITKENKLNLTLEPFQRIWLTNNKIEIPLEKIR